MNIDNHTLKLVVLDWVNKVRSESGKSKLDSLPKGIKHSASSCPLAKALDANVNSTSFRDPKTEVSKGVPILVSKFVRKFDAGELPELDATRK